MISIVRMLPKSNILHSVTLGMATVTGTEVTVIWDESELEAPSSSVTVTVTANVPLSWYSFAPPRWNTFPPPLTHGGANSEKSDPDTPDAVVHLLGQGMDDAQRYT